ncbi:MULTISPECIES: HAD domain-containing protein [unclassified Hydrogenophaga]|uniref:HAD domain-containing protein n=1 Tax=unclassified Hydrogenophaga TaxID=2610897 RepID=UPI001ACE6A83|nr:hypothetical protein [Hydrogenophaga sp.]
MRLVFLDFDGVLHPLDDSTGSRSRFCWLPHLVTLLQEAQDVGVVVHSTWRYEYSDVELRALLGELGPRFAGSAPRMPRELAIETVLQANASTVAHHLVLDDDGKEFSQGRLNLLLCDPALGVSDPRVQSQLRDWLVRTSTMK